MELPELDAPIRELLFAAKVLRDDRQRRIATHGSSFAAYMVLVVVDAVPGCSQREIADHLSLEKPTVTRQLDRMEADGLLTRQRDTTDRRIIRIHLTPDGAALHARLRRVVDAADADLTRQIAPDDVTAFRRVLTTLLANLERSPDEETSDHDDQGAA